MPKCPDCGCQFKRNLTPEARRIMSESRTAYWKEWRKRKAAQEEEALAQESDPTLAELEQQTEKED